MTVAESGILELVRSNIRRLRPYRCAREEVMEGILLDANENPFPAPRRGLLLNRYPDPHHRELRDALAARAGVGPDMMATGAGSDEVVDWLYKVFCDPGRDRVAIPEPTYGMYRVAADIFGVGIQEMRLTPGFDFDASQFLEEVATEVKLLFLCSPNNPTGNLLDRDEVLKACSSWKGIVVVDEAYWEFAGTESLAVTIVDHPNLVVMRTLSKAFGRAGLRIGYAIASPLIIDFFLKVKAPYNLSSVVQAEGLETATSVGEESARQIEAIVQERRRLAARLKEQPGVLEVFPSRANFLLFRCLHGPQLCRRLLDEGVVIRDRGSLPGLEGCVRVSVGLPEENDLFLDRLAQFFREKIR